METPLTFALDSYRRLAAVMGLTQKKTEGERERVSKMRDKTFCSWARSGRKRTSPPTTTTTTYINSSKWATAGDDKSVCATSRVISACVVESTTFNTDGTSLTRFFFFFSCWINILKQWVHRPWLNDDNDLSCRKVGLCTYFRACVQCSK